MSKQSFQIGDKVRLINIEDSYGYDLGVGEITEIFVDRVWDDEAEEMIESGIETLQVYFPKASMTFTAEDIKFIIA